VLFYQCLFHCSIANDKIVKYTERSWKTFKDAAEKRQNDIYEEFFLKTPDEVVNPHNGYHQLCYQPYTTSSKLKKFNVMQLESQSTVLQLQH